MRRPRLRTVLAVGVAFALAAPVASGDPQPRIVGGHPAAAGTWPAIVALEDLTLPGGAKPNYNQQICGGTLVAPQWVLTASHCVVDGTTGVVQAASRYAILYGTHSLDAPSTGTRVAVTAVDSNPAYNRSTHANDLALLELATPVPGATVLPIPAAALAGLWQNGRTAQIAGWGNLAPQDPDNGGASDYPYDLYEATVPYVSDADCGSVYTSFAPTVMTCAGDLVNGGVDTCQGDSGGPLVVADAAGDPVLFGDTSFGAGCAWPGVPGVYGEIAGMRAFVDATIGWSTAASASPASLGFAPSAAGTPTGAQTATLTSTGTAPLSITAARLTGAGAGDFRIVRDGCSQVVLTPGQACSVDVVAQTGGAAGGAALALDADGAASTTTVALSAAAVPPPPAPPVTPPVAPPTPKVAPPVAPPKAPALKALSGLSRHRLSVRLAGPGSVTITVARKVKKHGKTVSQTLATGSATFAKAGTKTITLKLTRAGKAALAHHRHAKATATVVVRSGTARGTSTRTLTLR